MVIRRYLATLADASNRKTPVRVFAVFGQIVLPVILATLLAVLGEHIVARSNLIVGISIVTALMCAVAVLIFQVRINLPRTDKRLTDRDYEAVDQVFSLSIWTIVVGLVLVLLLTTPDFLACIKESSEAFTFLVYLLTTHFISVIVVYVIRFVRAYERIAEKK